MTPSTSSSTRKPAPSPAARRDITQAVFHHLTKLAAVEVQRRLEKSPGNFDKNSACHSAAGGERARQRRIPAVSASPDDWPSRSSPTVVLAQQVPSASNGAAHTAPRADLGADSQALSPRPCSVNSKSEQMRELSPSRRWVGRGTWTTWTTPCPPHRQAAKEV